jgi:UDP-N-acetylmuramoyl-tripeptide--D-alanyl-D-alanine ligase
MITLSLLDIAEKLSYPTPTQNAIFTGISTDTRQLMPNNLFVAIRGENFDGHSFVEAAHKNGAIAALVDHAIASPIPQLVVNDTLEALGKITALWRNQFSLPIVGVTGSNGKTTLKNMLANILLAACKQDAQSILATEGNLNNHIGLPLMLARLNAQHRFAVLEMGMNHFNEIAYLTQLAKPTVAVITNAAECHLEGVGDVAGVAKAKGEIFLGLSPNGIAVLNADDAHFSYWKSLLGQHRLLSFGLENTADVTAALRDNQHITLLTPIGKIDLTLALLGKHNIMNALAATASALALHIDLDTIKQGLENTHPTPGRLQQYFLANGVRIIDDTYNANPFSTKAAIHTLATLPGTKILILGDMKELGKDAQEFHTLTGQTAAQAGIDHLLTYGNLSEMITQGFGKNAEHFTDRDKLLSALQPFLQNDATVLIKGSRSMQMEYFVKKLIPQEQLKEAH